MSMNSISSNNTMAPLVVQWLKTLRGVAGDTGSILGQGSSTCREVWPKKKRKKKKIKTANLKKNTNVVSLSFQLQVVAYISCVYSSVALSLIFKAHHPDFCIQHHVTVSAASCFTCHPLMTTVAMTLDSPS